MRAFVAFVLAGGIALGVMSPMVVIADEGTSQESAQEDAQDNAQGVTSRQYNDRLPPVLPGEEVVTETGQRMRVWSSAGPVPRNPQPTPQWFNGSNGTNAPALIIDGRIGHDKPLEPGPRR